MAPVTVVSGFIEIPDHPRGLADYKALGEGLEAAVQCVGVPMVVADQEKVGDTFLAQYLKAVPNPAHAVGDNPEKNTLAYHCVQHQKFVWLSAAAAQDSDNTSVFVWIDYGILHVPGVTVAVIQRYLERIGDYGSSVILPGCWPKGDVRHETPCWRFCGGLMAVPAPLVKTFTRGVMGTAARQIMTTRTVEWEVNTLARFEQGGLVPMTWYQADHNETMFDNLP